MFQTFRNAWKIPELKKSSPVHAGDPRGVSFGLCYPGAFRDQLCADADVRNGDMLSYLNMMSGGALARCTLFALGVTPYIKRLHYCAAAHRGNSRAGKSGKGSRRPAEAAADQPVRSAVVALIMSIG